MRERGTQGGSASPQTFLHVAQLWLSIESGYNNPLLPAGVSSHWSKAETSHQLADLSPQTTSDTGWACFTGPIGRTEN